ncbi:MAG: ThuA domain-containing protein [Victivallales bacterium]|nr:ThuA domain-containing protein [Victivallales bacterium]
MVNVTIWNEYRQEKKSSTIHEVYPNGIHAALAQGLASDDLEIRTSVLDDPGQGLTDDILDSTDVLLWWAHVAHNEVSDENVRRIMARIHSGMGLIVLHSGHYSKLFQAVCGTSCSLKWRESGEKERVWCIAPEHPIARNVPETFCIPHTEMYGERFDIPDDARPIFMSWYEGGEVFRSGITLRRGYGRIFYFSPGHESFPIYRQQEVLQVIGNAIRWAAPDCRRNVSAPPVPNLEPIRNASTTDRA